MWKKLSRTWHRAEFMATIQESDRPVKVCSQKDKRHPTQNRVPHFVMQSFSEWSFPKAASGRDAPGGSGSLCQADSQKGTAISYFIALLFRCLQWPAPWWADRRCWWNRWHRSACSRRLRQRWRCPHDTESTATRPLHWWGCVKSVLHIAAIWKQYFTAGHYESIIGSWK